MRGPFELLGDCYDYYYDYVRWYAHRRLLFSDYSWEQAQKDLSFKIFRNKDYENVAPLVKQTTLIGGAAGLSIASMQYIMLTEINKLPQKKIMPSVLGMVMVGLGIGLSYGVVVNAAAKFRDNKDGPSNHMIAALATIPPVGVYAKKNKVMWGIWNAFLIGGICSLFKLGAMGKMSGVNVEDLPKRLQSHNWATEWRKN